MQGRKNVIISSKRRTYKGAKLVVKRYILNLMLKKKKSFKWYLWMNLRKRFLIMKRSWFFLRSTLKRGVVKRLFKKILRYRWSIRRKKRLKGKICFLHLKTFKNNYYLTLTDTTGKVLIYCSAGMVRYNSRSKKIKNSVNQVHFMVRRIVKKLRELYCNVIKVKLKVLPNRHIYFTLNALNRKRINIKELWNIQHIPHHLGRRLKKQRRI